MAMQVESFEVTEVNEYGAEFEQEQIALIDQLGLDGQKKLISRPDEDSALSLCPYRKVTKEEHFVYTTLFPVIERLERYSSGPIPTRVLQIAAHAKTCVPGVLMVWRAENAKEDPILTCHPEAYDFYSKDAYILARWGDCLAPFEELTQKAIKVASEKAISALNEIKLNIERDITLLRAETNLQYWMQKSSATPGYAF